MRIIYDYQVFSTLPYGGVSRYFVELAKRISSMYHCDTKILAPLHINHFLRNTGAPLVKGAYMPNLRKTHQIRATYNKLITKHWVKKNQIDIFHETWYHPINRINDAKHLTTVHDMIDEKFPEFLPQKTRDYRRYIKQKALDRADHIICVSEKTKSDLIEIMKISTDRISVVHHGIIPPQNFTFLKPIISSPYILYVGMRYKYKNFDRLLKAYCINSKLNKNFKIVCFGGNKISTEEITILHNSKISKNNLIWINGGNDQILRNLYQNASAFIYPSLYEGFGFPPIEAMANHCPVVSSNKGSLPEVIGNAGVYFDPYDYEEMAEKILSVIDSQKKRQELIKLGLTQYSKYSWDTCANKTMKIYKSII